MNSIDGNLFELPDQTSKDYEYFQSIISSGDVTIERIISRGQKTPDDQWLEHDRNEWVILLQGESELSFFDGRKKILKPGDYFLISKNLKHRVERTSKDPPCIWLAVYY